MIIITMLTFCCFSTIHQMQRAKKVLSDILRLVDFAIRQVNSALNLPNQQVKFLGESELQTEELLSILFIKMTLGLVTCQLQPP